MATFQKKSWINIEKVNQIRMSDVLGSSRCYVSTMCYLFNVAGCVSDCPPSIKDVAKQRNNSTVSLVRRNNDFPNLVNMFQKFPCSFLTQAHSTRCTPEATCYGIIIGIHPFSFRFFVSVIKPNILSNQQATKIKNYLEEKMFLSHPRLPLSASTCSAIKFLCVSLWSCWVSSFALVFLFVFQEGTCSRILKYKDLLMKSKQLLLSVSGQKKGIPAKHSNKEPRQPQNIFLK